VAGDFTIRGADEFKKLSADLKAAGRKDLRSELFKGINRAAKPLRAAAKDGAAKGLPQRGGLAASVSKGLRITVSKTTGRNPGIRLKGVRGNYGLTEMDDGTIYSRRQQITPKWWTDALEAEAPAVVTEIERAVDDIRRQLENG
jgi:hypothetical protein